MAKNNT